MVVLLKAFDNFLFGMNIDLLFDDIFSKNLIIIVIVYPCENSTDIGDDNFK